MKINNLFRLSFVALAALTIAACTDDDNVTNNGLPEFDRSVYPTRLSQGSSTNALENYFSDDEVVEGTNAPSKIKTKLEDGKYVWSWMNGDKIWAEWGGRFIQNSTSTIDVGILTDKWQHWADFYFTSRFGEERVKVRYTGNSASNTAKPDTGDGNFGLGTGESVTSTNGTTPDRVTIAAHQYQKKIGCSDHIGLYGDCATAEAVKISGPGSQEVNYEFELTHRAAYLVFTPLSQVESSIKTEWEEDRVKNTKGTGDEVKKPSDLNLKLRSIKVEEISETPKTICGTYEFGDNGLKLDSEEDGGNIVTLHIDKTEGLGTYQPTDYVYYMVIKPTKSTAEADKYNLRVTYEFDCEVLNCSGSGTTYSIADKTITVTKDLGKASFSPNKFSRIAHKVEIQPYREQYNYYAWGAGANILTNVYDEGSSTATYINLYNDTYKWNVLKFDYFNPEYTKPTFYPLTSLKDDGSHVPLNELYRHKRSGTSTDTSDLLTFIHNNELEKVEGAHDNDTYMQYYYGDYIKRLVISHVTEEDGKFRSTLGVLYDDLRNNWDNLSTYIYKDLTTDNKARSLWSNGSGRYAVSHINNRGIKNEFYNPISITNAPHACGISEHMAVNNAYHYDVRGSMPLVPSTSETGIKHGTQGFYKYVPGSTSGKIVGPVTNEPDFLKTSMIVFSDDTESSGTHGINGPTLNNANTEQAVRLFVDKGAEVSYGCLGKNPNDISSAKHLWPGYKTGINGSFDNQGEDSKAEYESFVEKYETAQTVDILYADNVKFLYEQYRSITRMPNANEVAWYIKQVKDGKADIWYDDNTLWFIDGKGQYVTEGGVQKVQPAYVQGGVWIRKRQWNLGDKDAKDPDGTDLRSATAKTITVNIEKRGVPKDKENYFFLPFQGYYNYSSGETVTLTDVGVAGYYWTRTPHPSDRTKAYYLKVTQDKVILTTADMTRWDGLTANERPDWYRTMQAPGHKYEHDVYITKVMQNDWWFQ